MPEALEHDTHKTWSPYLAWAPHPTFSPPGHTLEFSCLLVKRCWQFCRTRAMSLSLCPWGRGGWGWTTPLHSLPRSLMQPQGL